METMQREGALISAPGAVEEADVARAIAEVQAQIIMAKRFPRDETEAYNRVMKACERKSLAKLARYSYPRGGQAIEGPSIRLAEVIARAWGNIQYGFRELGRGVGGYSDVEAYAWDLEVNLRVSRSLQVAHTRDKRSGPVRLEADRDIYEHVASQAQRRVRACLLEVIPGDVVEAAEQACIKTLTAELEDKPMEDRIRDMVVAFDRLGVTKEMLEVRLYHAVEVCTVQEVVNLQSIYNAIKDGIGKREDYFEFKATKPAAAPDIVPPAGDPPLPKENEVEVTRRALVKTFDERIAKLGIPFQFVGDCLFDSLKHHQDLKYDFTNVEDLKVWLVEQKRVDAFIEELKVYAEAKAAEDLAGEAGDKGDKSEGTDPPPPARLPETLQLPPGDPDWRTWEPTHVVEGFLRDRNAENFRAKIKAHPEVMYCAGGVVEELRSKWARKTKAGPLFGDGLSLDTFWGTQEEVKPGGETDPSELIVEWATDQQIKQLNQLIAYEWKIGWPRFYKWGFSVGRCVNVVEEGMEIARVKRTAAETILAEPELTKELIDKFFE